MSRNLGGMTSSSGMNQSGPNSGNSNNSPANTHNGPANVRVFVQRDYRLGIAIRFSNEFPPELNGRVDQASYEYTLAQINSFFEKAEDFNCPTFCDSFLGFLTANLIYICRDTRYEKSLRRLSKFIVEQNRNVYLPRGLQITDPLERGLRCIEIVIFAEPPRS